MQRLRHLAPHLMAESAGPDAASASPFAERSLTLSNGVEMPIIGFGIGDKENVEYALDVSAAHDLSPPPLPWSPCPAPPPPTHPPTNVSGRTCSCIASTHTRRTARIPPSPPPPPPP
eukprot:COSAG04_NODE_13191_length_616_cov_1.541586_1_plen_116_part_10